jgi:hypothetical protein
VYPDPASRRPARRLRPSFEQKKEKEGKRCASCPRLNSSFLAVRVLKPKGNQMNKALRPARV